jgi:hypothetical protein
MPLLYAIMLDGSYTAVVRTQALATDELEDNIEDVSMEATPQV